MRLRHYEINGKVEYDETVKQLSNSGYIPANKIFIGRKVHVIILPNEETEKETKN